MARVIVYHSYYGCDTGCCGHTVELTADDGKESRKFEFAHPYDGDHLEFAKAMIRDEYGEEHVKDLDWDNCKVTENC